MAAWTPADVDALSTASCHVAHGMGAPARPCLACRFEAERVLGVVAAGIAARALREAAAEWGVWLIANDTWRGNTVAATLTARADEIERAS